MSKISVGLVDDQELFTAGLAMIVNSQADLETVWEASNGLEGLQEQAHRPAQVTLMDLSMPVLDGFSALERWMGGSVVVLTTFDDDDSLFRALAAGASGFLAKDCAPEEILSAIRTVHSGDAVISPRATVGLISRLRPTLERPTPPGERAGHLTEREGEVLTLIANGMSNREIAAHLMVALPTVKTHVSQILSKTNSRDRVQAALWAVRHHVVNLDDTGM